MLADALLERGDPRGEVIQLSLAEPLSPQSEERRAELCDCHEPEWHRAYREAPLDNYDLRGGLITSAIVSLDRPERLDWLVENTPVESLWISDFEAGEDWLEWFPTHPLCRRLKSLQVEAEDVRVAPALLARGAFPNLEKLQLFGELTVSLAQQLAALPKLRILKFGELRDDTRFSPAAFDALGSLGLRSFSLHRGVLRSANVLRGLARPGTLQSIAFDNVTGPADAVIPLAGSLTRLDLAGLDCEGPGLQRILTAASKVESLRLGLGVEYSGGLAAAVRAIKSQPVDLELVSLRIKSDDSRAARDQPALSSVKQLRLEQCQLTNSAAALLATASWPLSSLTLSGCAFDPSVLERASLCRDLKSLEVTSPASPFDVGSFANTVIPSPRLTRRASEIPQRPG